MAEYQLTATDAVIRTADGASIPNDPDNKDWQEYQIWLDDGGVPDPYVKPPKELLATIDFIAAFTNAEYRAATGETWRQTGPNAKNWDVVVFEDNINLSNQKTAALKQSLVADGILTQVRADVIFSTPQ